MSTQQQNIAHNSDTAIAVNENAIPQWAEWRKQAFEVARDRSIQSETVREAFIQQHVATTAALHGFVDRLDERQDQQPIQTNPQQKLNLGNQGPFTTYGR